MLVGPRHFDGVMVKQYRAFGIRAEKKDSEQGFLDQHGAFYSRTEAFKIAQKNCQIRQRVGGDTANGGTLFSENLY